MAAIGCGEAPDPTEPVLESGHTVDRSTPAAEPLGTQTETLMACNRVPSRGKCSTYAHADPATLDFLAAACEGASGTWTKGACPDGPRLGHCVDAADFVTITTVFYAFDPDFVDTRQARKACHADWRTALPVR